MGVTQRPGGGDTSFFRNIFPLAMDRSIFLVGLVLLFYICEVSEGQRYTKVTRTYYTNSNSRSNNSNQRSYNSRQRTYNNNNSQSRFSNFQNFNGRKSVNKQKTYSNPSNNNNRRVSYNRNQTSNNGRNYQTRRLDTEPRSYGDNSVSP